MSWRARCFWWGLFRPPPSATTLVVYSARAAVQEAVVLRLLALPGLRTVRQIDAAERKLRVVESVDQTDAIGRVDLRICVRTTADRRWAVAAPVEERTDALGDER